MTRSTMKSLFRRQVHDPSVTWDDGEVNDLLNAALPVLQAKIMEVKRDAFMETARRTITNGVAEYDLAVGSMSIYEIRLLDPVTLKYGVPLNPKPLNVVRAAAFDNANVTPTAPTMYAREGEFLILGPTPNYTIGNGIQVIYVPTLQMATDSEVPTVAIALHPAIPLLAKYIVLEETEEDTKELQTRIAYYTSLIPTIYGPDLDTPTQVQLDLRTLS